MLGVSAVASPDSPFGLPLWLGIAAMYAIVLVRAQATYWLGRALGAGFTASRWADRIGRGRIERAEAVVARYGPVAVTLSFLTVGVQTAVNAVAGTTRMPFGRYLAAMLIGSALWAVIWTVGGVGVIWGAVLVATRSPVAAVVAAVAVLAVTVTIAVHRRRARPRSIETEAK